MAATRTIQARHIAGQIKATIEEQSLKSGDVLPSLRSLATRYEVSHETIRRAMQLLEDQGIVHKQQGLGTVVSVSGQTVEAKPAIEDLVPYVKPLASQVLEFATCEYAEDKLPVWQALIAAFRRQHPEIKIRLIPMPQVIPGSTAVPGDIIHNSRSEVLEWGRMGQLLNLSPWTDDLVAEGALFGGVAKDFQCDPCWAVPVSFDVHLTFVNDRLLSPDTITWLRENNDLIKILDWAIEQSPGEEVVALPPPWLLLEFAGVNVMRMDERETLFATLPTVLAQLKERHERHPLYPSPGSDNYISRLNRFQDNRASLTYAHTFSLTECGQAMPRGWSVMPIPAAGRRHQLKTTLGCGISRRCSDAESAVTFVQFLVSELGQEIMASGRNNVPILREAAESDVYSAAPPTGMQDVIRALDMTYEYSDDRFPAQFTAAYSGLWTRELLEYLNGYQDLQDTVNRLLRKTGQLIKAYRSA